MLACAIPNSVIVCPYCGGPLNLEVSEWDGETRVPTMTGVHLSCEHETPDGPDHTNMPYVYWLPAQRIVHAWIVATGMTVNIEQEPRAWLTSPPTS